MRSYPLRPLLIPGVLGAVTAFALLAALLSDGPLETLSVILLAGVVVLVILRLVRRGRG
ncbi:hypothetical protein P7B02_11510 [Caulobacter segnis]|uniref:hypothetical protein n=1 Tax=Caulobacter segnis TaxID=88688 RepID=UPI00240F5C32|nr:hypothetical protein [Caulobacter segnis]MDG2522168.1 hypothetical protein [Caulobacter segnis]